MLAVVREVQVPLLAVLLVGGCAAKARRAVSARSVAAATGPTVLFPLRLHRPAAIGVCVSELALGAGLLLTADRAGPPALAVRGATGLLFAVRPPLRAIPICSEVYPTPTWKLIDISRSCAAA